MDTKSNAFPSKRKDASRHNVKTSRYNGHVYTGDSTGKKPPTPGGKNSDAKTEFLNGEEHADQKYRKERDKKECDNGYCATGKPVNVANIMDQDLEFYPTDDLNSSPSTFSAWDAFLTGNQAFFRDPCYPSDYTCAESFSYMDVIPEEDDVSVLESDTDDTGSSVSTVIDKFSRTSTANSSFSERIRTSKEDNPIVTFDLEQVLSPFEQLEKELDEDGSCPRSVATSQSSPVVIVTSTTGISDTGVKEISAKDFASISAISSSTGSGQVTEDGTGQPEEETTRQFQDCAESQNRPQSIGQQSASQAAEKVPRSQTTSTEKSSANGTPPLPSRMPNKLATSKLKKDGHEKTFTRSESYQAPVVPPRQSKHIAARRTRSDPGSSEPSTPSRIPRPTFAVRSPSVEKANTSPCGAVQRVNHSKTARNTSPKSTPPKRLKFTKNFETNLDKSNDRGQQHHLSNRSSLVESSTASSCDNDFDDADTDCSLNEFRVTTSDYPFGRPETEEICMLKNNNNCKESKVSGKSGVPPFTPKTDDLLQPSGTESRGQNTPDNLSGTPAEAEYQHGNGLTVACAPETPVAAESGKQIPIPQIHIIQEDDEMVVEEDLGFITEGGSQSEDYADENVVEDGCAINHKQDIPGSAVVDTEPNATGPSEQVAETERLQRLPTDTELNPEDMERSQNACKSETETAVTTLLDESSNRSGLETSEPKSIDPMDSRSTQNSEDNDVREMNPKGNTLPEGTLSKNNRSAGPTQQRPLQDILQALDNLCLASSIPKEVEINIDWGPTDDAGIKIKQKILSSESTSCSGSTIEDDQDFATDLTPDDNVQGSEETALDEDRSMEHKVGEPQQTTQSLQPLPASAVNATSPPFSSEAHCEEDNPEEEEEEIVETKRIGNSTEETTFCHASSTTGGQCHLDNDQELQKNPSRSREESQSIDVISDDSAMDTLRISTFREESTNVVISEKRNAQAKDSLSHEQSIANDSVNESHSLAADTEETTATRHSSGCDDSGVFLEDLPYMPENTLSLASEELSQGKLNKSEYLARDMRQYNIELQLSLDSDAERSDDLGLASSSVDSADDLDGDPLPSSIKIDHHPPPPPPPAKKKPPPVPPRRYVSSARCEFQAPTESGPPDSANTHDTSSPAVPEENVSNRLGAPSQKSSSESFRWKSEECLRSAVESKWIQRQNEKPISVKDRIAMFTEMQNSPKKPESGLHRFSSETDIKSSENSERNFETTPDRAMNSGDFNSLTNETKWYSMYSLPLSVTNQPEKTLEAETGPLKPSQDISSITTVSSREKLSDGFKENDSEMSKKKYESLVTLEKPLVSRYPQTQLIANRRYSYGPYCLNSIRTTEDILFKKTSPSSILSIMESRKQPLAKLKGLVIPDKPVLSGASKELPTIVSSDSMIITAKTDADLDGNAKNSFTNSSSYKTMSLPRTKSEMKAKFEISNERELSKPEIPAWKPPIPKDTNTTTHSSSSKPQPAALTASLSPTPPSSITSPLSPPPSSPSSICSSNASSATSVATMQQNVFQFSLSHSKPVTPVLPEKPIMSPPSLPSDIEYEGDNSEDSSTSASPMITKHGITSSRSHGKRSVTSSPGNDISSGSKEEVKTSFFSRTETSSGCTVNNASENRNGILTCAETERPCFGTENSAFNKLPTSRSYENPAETDFGDRNEEKRYSFQAGSHGTTTNGELGFSRPRADDGNSQSPGKNAFLATSQQVQSTKFRAQPLVLKNGQKNGTNGSSNQRQTEVSGFAYSRNVPSSNELSYCESNGHRSEFATNENEKTFVSEYRFYQSKQQWPQGDELSPFKKLESEDDDDSHSTISHRTEDSRLATDDYFSDATTDSFDKSLDPDLKPRRLSQQRVVLKAAVDGTDSVKKFKALAEKWEHRADVPSPPPAAVPSRRESKNLSSPMPGSSSFLSSIINSSTNGKSPSSSVSNPLKLPPSLMPRKKESSNRSSDSGSSVCSVRRTSKGSLESKEYVGQTRERRSSRDTYETVWCDDRSTRSSSNASNNFSDSGSGTDTGSACSRSENYRIEKVKNFINADYNKPDGNQLRKTYDGPSVRASICNESKFFSMKSSSDNAAPSDTLDGSSRSRIVSSVTTSQTICSTDGVTKSYSSQARWLVGKEETRNSSTDYSKWPPRTESRHKTDYIRKSAVQDLSRTRNLSKSQVSLRDPLETMRSHGSYYLSSTKSVSVSDIRKAFESQCVQNQNSAAKSTPPPRPPPRPSLSEEPTSRQNIPDKNGDCIVVDHRSQSSIDSTVSCDSETSYPPRYGSLGSLSSIPRDVCGSVTSLESAGSLLTQLEMQQLIEDANRTLEETCSKKCVQQSVHVVILQREVPAGSIGITLAGGADYEVKEITVHKVISGSLADRDGRIRKGDRIISINGKNLKGVTHREALDILKSPRPEVVLVISRENENPYERDEFLPSAEVNGTVSTNANSKSSINKWHGEPPNLREGEGLDQSSRSVLVSVELQKDAAGLGFSLEGGKDSPLGDRPLVIKKVFRGGAADKDGQLEVGDEIISVNGQSVTNMTRTEAWNFLKKLPDGLITLCARKNVAS